MKQYGIFMMLMFVLSSFAYAEDWQAIKPDESGTGSVTSSATEDWPLPVEQIDINDVTEQKFFGEAVKSAEKIYKMANGNAKKQLTYLSAYEKRPARSFDSRLNEMRMNKAFLNAQKKFVSQRMPIVIKEFGSIYNLSHTSETDWHFVKTQDVIWKSPGDLSAKQGGFIAFNIDVKAENKQCYTLRIVLPKKIVSIEGNYLHAFPNVLGSVLQIDNNRLIIFPVDQEVHELFMYNSAKGIPEAPRDSDIYNYEAIGEVQITSCKRLRGDFSYAAKSASSEKNPFFRFSNVTSQSTNDCVCF